MHLDTPFEDELSKCAVAKMAIVLAQDLEQSNYEREQYREYWNDTFDENVTLQMELDKFNQ